MALSAPTCEYTPSSCCYFRVFLITLITLISHKLVLQTHAQPQQQQQVVITLEPGEKEAFYQVLESLNYEWDWRTLLPDPCGENTLQGMSCDTDDDQQQLLNSTLSPPFLHITALTFGQLQLNTPSCSSNATIHPSISKLTHLRSLSFYKCFISSPATIPASFGSLTSLTSLTFHTNPSLGGDIPSELGESLVSLERLVITGNPGLNGTLPLGLGSLISLKQLVISRNGIQGRIPPTLGSLSGLVILDLSENRLGFSLPEELGLLKSLKKLDVSRNSIQGEVSGKMIRGLETLELLDFSRNALNGSFPEAMVELETLRELYMNGNSIQGELPSSGWGKLKRLISLDVSSAGLSGRIPESLGEVKSLRFLGLSRNRFSGEIPVKLAELEDVNEIDLSGNLLVGPVPFSVDTMKRLGRKLKVDNNSGLCFPGGISMRSNDSLPDSVSSLSSCGKSSFPVAFQMDSPRTSSSDGLVGFGFGRFQHLITVSMLLVLLI